MVGLFIFGDDSGLVAWRVGGVYDRGYLGVLFGFTCGVCDLDCLFGLIVYDWLRCFCLDGLGRFCLLTL